MFLAIIRRFTVYPRPEDAADYGELDSLARLKTGVFAASFALRLDGKQHSFSMIAIKI